MHRVLHRFLSGMLVAGGAGCAVGPLEGSQEEDSAEVSLVHQAVAMSLFDDSFESGLGRWTTAGAVARSTSAAYSGEGSYGARADDAGALISTIDTRGISNVTVSYRRRTNSYDYGEYFYAEWSPDGASWTQMERTANSTSWALKSFTLPASASGHAALRLRFRSNANGYYERFDLDAVRVTGDSLVCTPDCSEKSCGDDGCGGSCGTCASGASCVESQCQAACVPSCSDKSCGDDGCGGSCGTCAAGATCSLSGVCEAAVQNPGAAGPFSVCSYTASLADNGYSSAIVSYPCNTSGPLAATTLTGGYTNTKEDMYWMKDRLASHGYIVIAMTPNNTWGDTTEWYTAHMAGHAKLLSESGRVDSPIYGRVDPSRLQVMGFSKGGGGTLRAANELGSRVRATQALAPWLESSRHDTQWTGITSATACYAGSSDTTASATNVRKFYDNVPTASPRLFARFASATHGHWYGSDSTKNASFRARFATHIVAWMKVYLDGNTSYQPYLTPYETQVSSGWYDSPSATGSADGYTYHP